ncbi:glutathione S-transferase [Acinetobacter sp. V91_7]|jgi:glutathione S-transferase|uniref:glutathione S-transferase family protein n=1 Tax=unclassified Acinetobacter TaxID=196816 RepID=UPI00287D2D07|nr:MULTISPECIES: glutathione S-transferase [unclassified Acinetobacter]MDS7932993.1 glutathione S-transferase [Acinetobacter sp. V91_4B]MDS7962944.1 glutathione S-transferase [Acinetobacter sp. V91_7]MDS8026067.1 glutathione S-transferase [Acinetobacter sp. V91_13]
MLKILGRDNSINVRKVLWLCEELNLEYEREDWGRGVLSTQSPEFLQLNPNGQIPVVLDGDLVLWQSNSIIRYLANAYDKENQLYPPQAKERFFVDQWLDWQAIELNNSWTYTIMSLLRHSPDHQDPNLLQQGIDKWNRHMQMLDQQLAKTQAYVAGSQFSLADIPIGLSVQRWKATPFDHPTLSHVDQYFELLNQRAGFLKWGNNGEP